MVKERALVWGLEDLHCAFCAAWLGRRAPVKRLAPVVPIEWCICIGIFFWRLRRVQRPPGTECRFIIGFIPSFEDRAPPGMDPSFSNSTVHFDS
jgi:hypothetical protein